MGVEVKKVEKKYRLSLYEAVKYQLLTELIFFRKEQVTLGDIDLLALLAIYNGIELSKFCTIATNYFHPDVPNYQFANKSQNIRNKVNKLLKQKIINRDNQRISLNNISVATDKTMLLTYNFLSVDDSNKA